MKFLETCSNIIATLYTKSLRNHTYKLDLTINNSGSYSGSTKDIKMALVDNSAQCSEAYNRNSSFYGLDCTDNQTTVITEVYPKPRYSMNDRFCREDERLKTFEYWPVDFMDKRELALTGMFYTGVDDKVKCYFCEVEIGCWEPTDQAVSEHMHWSPHCPLLRRRTTNNLPINVEALNRVLPHPSYDVCGHSVNNIEQMYPASLLPCVPVNSNSSNSSANNSISNNSNSNSNSSSGNNNSSSSSSNYFPEYPEYAVETARVRSFAEWPRNMKQKPEQLAEAGFFYTGIGDRVKCFSCGGGLKDWDDSDEPWEQHALWLSKCRYVRLLKGQSYIDTVKQKQKAKELSELEQASSSQCSNVNRSEACATLKSCMSGLAMPLPVDASSLTTVNAAATAATDNLNEQTVQNVLLKPNIASEDIVAANSKSSASSSSNNSSNSNNNEPEEKLCKICFGGEYNTAFLPCGHVVACAKCASSITKCPLCRKPFTDVMRVYFS